MPAMPAEPVSELSSYRVSLFFGPQRVDGESSIQACVFNVKKRSWKGGVQVAVELTDTQIASVRAASEFHRWLDETLRSAPNEERKSLEERAEELFIQALCRCKLDLLLQAGITQENQCFTADTGSAEWEASTRGHRDLITSYVAAELDLAP